MTNRTSYTAIAIVSDLIFATRIRATAESLGAECRIIAAPDGLETALREAAPSVVIVDMHVASLSPAEAIRKVKTAWPTTRVAAFSSHVQTELMASARVAGADDVWPRSKFVQELPSLFQP